ncbi:hypothetical protein BC938DRAFT_480683 [Jimgerdemannia flammicorona]|uniref:F-box domain-containing protein n=1 Tax=Jimgerdemannia flammicorona TaxID=994334 RepID=A0A433QHZ9_9FUNG|nr:hypothetical protein BC938DRAFT_480683 [Jimgerdemannia flammicorona]
MGDGEEVFWLAVVTPSLHYTMRGGERTIFRSNLVSSTEDIPKILFTHAFMRPKNQHRRASSQGALSGGQYVPFLVHPLTSIPLGLNAAGEVTGQFAAGVRRVWKDRWEGRRAGEGRLFSAEWAGKATAMLEEWINKQSNFAKLPTHMDFTKNFQEIAELDNMSTSYRFMYWLPDAVTDNDLDHAGPGFQKIALVLEASDSETKESTGPFGALFDKAVELHLRPEFHQSNPRHIFGLEKIATGEYRIFKKHKEFTRGNRDPVATRVPKIPPEIVRMILVYALDADGTADLMPTIFCCRLVNRTWHDIATELIHSELEIPATSYRRFISSPQSYSLPHLRNLHLHHHIYRRQNCNSFVVDAGGAPTEADISFLVARSPCLEHLLVEGAVSRAEYYQPGRYFDHIFAHVLGHRPELERNLIRRLKDRVLSLASLRESAAHNKKDIARDLFASWRQTPLYFFCLSEPSDELLVALADVLHAMVEVGRLPEISGFMRGQERPVIKVRFDGKRGWPWDEQQAWLVKKIGWIRENWPKRSLLAVTGTVFDPEPGTCGIEGWIEYL